MNRTIAFSMLLAPVAGCGLQPPVDCTGANGKDVTIRYGDARIEVTYKVKVKQDEKIVLKLHPENMPASGVDYENLEISLVGKSLSDSWLNRDVKASDPEENKIICVNNKEEGEYEYAVDVPGVGIIDPRVEVEPN